MSGSNPFRRKFSSDDTSIGHTLVQVEIAENVEQFSTSGPGTQRSRNEDTRPSSRTKVVRIVSPSIPPQCEEMLPGQQRTAPSQALRRSTSPSHSDYFESSSNEAFSVDPFAVVSQEEEEESEDKELLRNTRNNSSVLAPYSPSDSRRPLNPFKRSLVNREEPSGAMSADTDKSVARPTPVGKIGSSTALDVDAFKRLLMTGEKDITASGTPATPPAQTYVPLGVLGDSSSNTDTSSLSRQSIFESIAGAQPDTPRTSHEISVSDDERQQLVRERTRRKKPQPPKTRHGRLVKSNVPKTVSFVDLSLSSSAFENTPSAIAVQAIDMNPQSPKTPTDLNKPLPPAPVFMQSEKLPNAQQGFSKLVELPNNSPSTSPPATSQKKKPPTPPLNRRHSQLRTSKPLLSRSNSARLPARPEDGLTSSALSADAKAPPPPPTRRTSTGQGRSSFENPTQTTRVLADPSSSAIDSISSVRSHTSKPPPPPTRTPSISSIQRPYRASPNSSSAAMPPPVPPPRNRGSSQSSFDSTRFVMSPSPSANRSGPDLRRTSTESQRKGSGASITGSPTMVAAVSGASANDILADLSLLQKEVDELRGKYDMSKASQ